MKIKSEQLGRTLSNAKTSPPLVWLAGDEPLLMQESADLVRSHFRAAGISEREVFTVERGFNWESFLQATGNLSLFGERKLIDLRLASAKLDDSGKKALQSHLDNANPDLVVLVSSPHLEKATLNTKWFKAIEAESLLVQIWPVNRENLAQWLQQRLLREKISADNDALQILVDRVEGNLLAAMQEIEKLKLLAKPEADGSLLLDGKTALQLVANNSRYTAFAAVDAALLGDVARAQKILLGLKAEGIMPQPILAAVIRELRLLQPMVRKKEQGQGINAIVQTARVWFNRKQAVSSAIRRLGSDDIWQILERARRADQAGKGMLDANAWDELSTVLLALSGAATATMAHGTATSIQGASD